MRHTRPRRMVKVKIISAKPVGCRELGSEFMAVGLVAMRQSVKVSDIIDRERMLQTTGET